MDEGFVDDDAFVEVPLEQQPLSDSTQRQHLVQQQRSVQQLPLLQHFSQSPESHETLMHQKQHFHRYDVEACLQLLRQLRPRDPLQGRGVHDVIAMAVTEDPQPSVTGMNCNNENDNNINNNNNSQDDLPMEGYDENCLLNQLIVEAFDNNDNNFSDCGISFSDYDPLDCAFDDMLPDLDMDRLKHFDNNLDKLKDLEENDKQKAIFDDSFLSNHWFNDAPPTSTMLQNSWSSTISSSTSLPKFPKENDGNLDEGFSEDSRDINWFFKDFRSDGNRGETVGECCDEDIQESPVNCSKEAEEEVEFSAVGELGVSTDKQLTQEHPKTLSEGSWSQTYHEPSTHPREAMEEVDYSIEGDMTEYIDYLSKEDDRSRWADVSDDEFGYKDSPMLSTWPSTTYSRQGGQRESENKDVMFGAGVETGEDYVDDGCDEALMRPVDPDAVFPQVRLQSSVEPSLSTPSSQASPRHSCHAPSFSWGMFSPDADGRMDPENHQESSSVVTTPDILPISPISPLEELNSVLFPSNILQDAASLAAAPTAAEAPIAAVSLNAVSLQDAASHNVQHHAASSNTLDFPYGSTNFRTRSNSIANSDPLENEPHNDFVLNHFKLPLTPPTETCYDENAQASETLLGDFFIDTPRIHWQNAEVTCAREVVPEDEISETEPNSWIFVTKNIASDHSYAAEKPPLDQMHPDGNDGIAVDRVLDEVIQESSSVPGGPFEISFSNTVDGPFEISFSNTVEVGRTVEEEKGYVTDNDDDDDDDETRSSITMSSFHARSTTTASATANDAAAYEAAESPSSQSMIEMESRLISSSTRMYNQDTARARALGIQTPIFKLITMKVEDFNALVKRCTSPDQASLMRDIRKRGKNKVAAMNCRRRKMKKLDNTQERVNHLVKRRDQLVEEEKELEEEVDFWRKRYSKLHENVSQTSRNIHEEEEDI